MAVERGMTPKPNSEYFDNGHKYRTDEHGRTVITEGWVGGSSAARNPTAQVKAGGYDRQDRDHGGHGIASSLGGSGEAVNLTAQQDDLNTGGSARFGEVSDADKERSNAGEGISHYNIENYRDMERFLSHEISKGKKVYFQKRNYYDGDSKRPSRYEISVLIYDSDADSRPRSHNFTFYNVDKEGRERQRNEAREVNVSMT